MSDYQTITEIIREGKLKTLIKRLLRPGSKSVGGWTVVVLPSDLAAELGLVRYQRETTSDLIERLVTRIAVEEYERTGVVRIRDRTARILERWKIWRIKAGEDVPL